MQPEPPMDEILASIKRIIHDEAENPSPHTRAKSKPCVECELLRAQLRGAEVQIDALRRVLRHRDEA